jgi:hypothetical protein
MEDNKEINRVLDAYKKEIRKSHIDNEIEKQKFVRDINTYIKKEPSVFHKIKSKILKFFKYI